MKNVKAQVIGETSAGMLAVQIYEDDKLVWSHDYFAMGATESQYHKYMQQAREDAEACNDWRDFDGCDYDENGEIVDHSTVEPSWIVARYYGYSDTWGWGEELRNDGMSEDFLRHHPDIAAIVGYGIDED